MREKTATTVTAFRLYLLLAPLLYAAFALLTPPFQTPDEPQHLFRTYQLAHGGLIAERRGEVSGGEVAPGLLVATTRELGTLAPHTARTVPQAGWSERFARATPVEADKPWQFANFQGAAPYTPAGYGPQMVAVWAGDALQLSVENTIRLGRLLNALVTFAMLALALQLIPGGRVVVLLVGLLPMTAACAASFGQDGVIIGGSALLVALALRGAARGCSSASSLATVVLTALVTLAKYVYLPLGALGLLATARSGKLRIAWPSAIAVGLAALLTLAWLKTVSHLSVPMHPGYPVPAEQLQAILVEPANFAVALARSFAPDRLLVLFAMLFTFGWLNVGPVFLAALCAAIAVSLVWWFGGEDRQPLPRYWRVWWLLLCASVAVAMAMALYLGGNPLGARTIEGLQGRYYLPLALPLLLALRRQRGAAWPRLPLAIAALMVAANVLCLLAIARAFYA